MDPVKKRRGRSCIKDNPVINGSLKGMDCSVMPGKSCEKE
jgi:hypothetical protein